METKEYIHKKRPNLSTSSVTTYASVLKSLYKKIWGDGAIHWDKFDNTKEVMDFLKDVPPNKRKTTLSALVIITDKSEYRDQMLSDVRDYNKEIQKQEKTPAQEENWVNETDVRKVFDALKSDAMALLKKKQNLRPAELQEVQNFVIMALLSGIYIPPRRSKDYCDFKIKNIDEEKDNFIKKGKLVFNSYKTSKTYGTQEVEIGKSLASILNVWLKRNPTEWLLIDSNMNHLTPVKLNQRLNKIFDKKIAVNALRHSFLTSKYAEHSKKEKELEEDVAEMGTSKAMLVNYVKL
jgi:DNA-binding ferritin-like protein (Dps family)